MTEPLRDGWKFLRLAFANPKQFGAVLPSSRALSRAMAAAALKAGARPVLELGPGTGAVTAAILAAGIRPQKLVAIERGLELLPDLERRYPGVRFIGGDAFEVGALLAATVPEWRGQIGAVVSSLPLLNFPFADRDRLLDQLGEWICPDATIVQYSYSLNRGGSLRGLEQLSSKVVWFNVPPARVSEFALGRRRRAGP